MSVWKKRGLILLLLFFGVFLIVPKEKTERFTVYPDPSELFFVNDYSSVLNVETERFLLTQATRLETAAQAQIVVVTVPNTQTESLEDYAIGLANQWGIGDKKLDNGVVLLFTTEEPHVRLEIGKGLEGAIPDAKAGRILDDYAVEAKNNGRWNQAAINTFSAVAALVYEEYGLTPPVELRTDLTPSESGAEQRSSADAEFPEAGTNRREFSLLVRILSAIVLLLPVILVAAIVLFIKARRKSKAKANRAADTRTAPKRTHKTRTAPKRTHTKKAISSDTAEHVMTVLEVILDIFFSGGSGGSSGGGHSGGGGSFGGGGASR